MARGAQAGTVSLAAVLGLGCLGRTGWGRAWRWHFPTPSAPWGRLVQRVHQGVPVLLGSSTGSTPCKECPSCQVLWALEVVHSPLLLSHSLSWLREKLLTKCLGYGLCKNLLKTEPAL